MELNALDDVGSGKGGRKPPLREIKNGILVDSGAGATVADGAQEFPEYELEPSVGSRAGQHYVGPGKERIPNRGQRKVRTRLCSETGPTAGMKFQDASVRRPILSVGESTEADNLRVFDRVESVLLPKGCPGIEQIRKLVKQAKYKMTMQKDRNTFRLPAWVEEPDDTDRSTKPATPFRGQGQP